VSHVLDHTMLNERLRTLRGRVEPHRVQLLAHPVYRSVDTLPRLRTFMEHHVFAVWDFMSLLKRLQREFTITDVPWLPPRDRLACRLINEIVLGEESDADGRGGFASHFELYLEAMRDVGADTSTVRSFIGRLQRGESVRTALADAAVPPPVRAFTRATFEFVDGPSIVAVAAAFTLGREDLVPEMFRRFVAGLDRNATTGLERFQYYLDRHIQLDEQEHGPMALQMLAAVCGDRDEAWREAEEAVIRAVAARTAFWDGVLAAITGSGV
jgi:hypothetical protein